MHLRVAFVLLLFGSGSTVFSVAGGQFKYPVMRGMAPLKETAYAASLLSAADSGLPLSFDWREQHPLCVHEVLNQGQCGSCWAFAATEVLSDRFCIASNGSVNVVLSPGDLLACEKLNLGCTMGSLPQWAFSYIKSNGVASNDCVPYTSGDGDTQKCSKGQCTNSSIMDVTSGKNNTRYYVTAYKNCGSLLRPSSHVNEIMKCILTGGPVDATFNVYSDFESYEDGVYTHKSGSFKGLHSVKVVGWGHDDTSGYDYWIVQNSWGRFWGNLGGYFHIRKGTNECGIERLMYAATPKLNTST